MDNIGTIVLKARDELRQAQNGPRTTMEQRRTLRETTERRYWRQWTPEVAEFIRSHFALDDDRTRALNNRERIKIGYETRSTSANVTLDKKETMLTYQDLEKLESIDSKFKRINRYHVHNRTRFLRSDADTFTLRYYSSDIVLIHRDGSFTVTPAEGSEATLSRILRYSPAIVVPSDLETGKPFALKMWNVRTYTTEYYPFAGSVRVDSNGKPIGLTTEVTTK